MSKSYFYLLQTRDLQSTQQLYHGSHRVHLQASITGKVQLAPHRIVCNKTTHCWLELTRAISYLFRVRESSHDSLKVFLTDPLGVAGHQFDEALQAPLQ